MQVFTIEESYLGGETPDQCVVLYGREPGGELRRVRVTDVPITLAVALGEDFYDEAQLVLQLEKALLRNPPRCRRLGCACKGDGFGIFREPCLKDRRRMQRAVRGFQRVRMFGFGVYEPEPRAFLEISLTCAFFLDSAVRFLKNADVGTLSESKRGVFDVPSNAVEAFVLSKQLVSFEWVDCSRESVPFEELRKLPFNATLAPFRVMHLDIETISPVYRDYESQQGLYPVGIVCCCLGELRQGLMLRAAGVTGEEDSAETRYFDDERQLLQAFRALVLAWDPDVLSGYSLTRFDVPYLLRRAERLGVASFPFFSREPQEPTVARVREFGGKSTTTISCPGRVVVDMYNSVQATYQRLDSYKLKDVAVDLKLGAEKDDVATEEIYPYFHDSLASRATLLRYCEKDVFLSLQLERRMDVLRRLSAKCRITRVPVESAVSRGNSYITAMMLCAEMRGEYKLPKLEKNTMPACLGEIEGYARLHENAVRGKQYDGAVVLEPKAGFYTRPVVTGDFESLYPNNMRTYNLCRSTQLLRPEPGAHVSPCGFAFVPESTRKGVIPKLLERLILARKDIRARQAEEKDKSVWAVLEAEQLETKVSANVFYGSLGDINGKFHSISIAASVAAWGAKNIRMLRDALIQSPSFEADHGRPMPPSDFVQRFGLDVKYGDTDSLMWEMAAFEENGPAVVEAANEVLGWINKNSGLLTGTLRMCFENVSMPFLLLKKKHYVKAILSNGVLKLKSSGLETRNMTPFVAEVLRSLLEAIMLRGASRDDVERMVFEAADRLHHGTYGDVLRLLHKTRISRPLESYANSAGPHLVAAKQLVNMGIAVLPGDRVEYYFCNISVGAHAKKGERVVCAPLIAQHTLHIPSYLDELYSKMEGTVLLFFHGNSESQRKAALRDAVFGHAGGGAVKLQVGPGRGAVSGPMDVFFTSSKEPVSKQPTLVVGGVAPAKRVRQMSLKSFYA